MRRTSALPDLVLSGRPGICAPESRPATLRPSIEERTGGPLPARDDSHALAPETESDQNKCVLLMEYSLPPDDVVYRAFLSARRQRKDDVRCTVINKEKDKPSWYGPDGLEAETWSSSKTIKAATDIFGEKNVRFYGGGVPNVFLDESGHATSHKLEELLDWHSTGMG